MYSEDSPLPIWRSLLFVPGNSARFINKAHTRGADAIVLDLEDSVPSAQKAFARQSIANCIDNVSQSGADVMVRINAPLRMAVRDLEAVVVPGVRAIVVPKASSAFQLNSLSKVKFDSGVPKRNRTRVLVIIGAGEVVRERYVPAILGDYGGDLEDIVVCSLEGASPLKGFDHHYLQIGHDGVLPLRQLNQMGLLSDVLLVIATVPGYHVH